MPDMFSTLPPPLCSRAVYTVKEVGKIANMSRASVFREFESGSLIRTKYGRKTRVKREDLIAWINGKPFEVQPDKDFDPEAHRAAQDHFSDVMNGFVDEHGNELAAAD